MNNLQFMLDKQREFQRTLGIFLNKGNHIQIKSEQDASYVKEQASFLIEETVEMTRELKYSKPWKQYDWDNIKDAEQTQKVKEEAIDALHFMLNIFNALGMSEQDILNAYLEKNKLNHERQSNPDLGYITEGK